MKLSMRGTHKSVSGKYDIEIPNFVVITGANGSGKTHLFEGIQSKRAPFYIVDGPTDSPINDIVSIDSDHLRKVVEHGRHSSDLSHGMAQSLKQAFLNAKEKWKEDDSKNFVFYMRNTRFKRILKQISQKLNKEIHDLSGEEITEFYPIDGGTINSDNIFENHLQNIFSRYYRLLESNRILHFYNIEYGEKNKFLPYEEFIKIYGPPPWETANKILKLLKLGFEFTYPVGRYGQFWEIKATLNHRYENIEIGLDELSSGEKTLIAIAISLYNSEPFDSLPQVILMDEPDSSLHPEMVKSLMEVIKGLFVDECQRTVIIITHSPTTIALSPEESIYLMDNKRDKPLVKLSKDEAISVLTKGIPTLSVDFDNRRQVFVESGIDQECYSLIWKSITDKIFSPISLEFIYLSKKKAGENSSGCDDVKRLVRELRGFGNDKIFGIIDWDTRNNPNKEGTFVLGQGLEFQRYSIENYLLDPIILCVYFLIDKKEKRIFGKDVLVEKELLNRGESHYDIAYFSEERLQKLSDYVIALVRAEIKNEDLDEDLIQCVYINRKSVKIPKWYLHKKGHTIDSTIRGMFGSLRRFKNKDRFKIDILERVVSDFTGLIPVDFLLIFQEIIGIEMKYQEKS